MFYGIYRICHCIWKTPEYLDFFNFPILILKKKKKKLNGHRLIGPLSLLYKLTHSVNDMLS